MHKANTIKSRDDVNKATIVINYRKVVFDFLDSATACFVPPSNLPRCVLPLSTQIIPRHSHVSFSGLTVWTFSSFAISTVSLFCAKLGFVLRSVFRTSFQWWKEDQNFNTKTKTKIIKPRPVLEQLLLPCCSRPTVRRRHVNILKTNLHFAPSFSY